MSKLRSAVKFGIRDANAWMRHSGVELADVINEDERRDVKLGAVGFMRAPAGQTTQFEFPYDEVLVVTKGRCTVRTQDGDKTASAGEVLYLFANAPGTFHTDEDTELVYVASSPYGEVNRAAKAELLR
jgi:ethanolamine utilization protein EutQ (cupin superfamily)